MSDIAGLEYLSQVIGIEHLQSLLDPRSPPNGVPVALPYAAYNVIRQSPRGTALLIHGTRPPATVILCS
jgi:hypothetical protein